MKNSHGLYAGKHAPPTLNKERRDLLELMKNVMSSTCAPAVRYRDLVEFGRCPSTLSYHMRGLEEGGWVARVGKVFGFMLTDLGWRELSMTKCSCCEGRGYLIDSDTSKPECPHCGGTITMEGGIDRDMGWCDECSDWTVRQPKT